MNAEEIKKEFDQNVGNFISGVVFSQGAVVGVLKKACRSDGDYRLALKALTGRMSSKELDDAQWNALYKFVLPMKPEGGKWQSGRGASELESMVNCLVNQAVDQPGQLNFLEQA